MNNSSNTKPFNIIIREATLNDSKDIAHIHVKAWQQTYRGMVNQNYLDNISFSKRLELRNKIFSKENTRQLNLVAVADNDIIGFCDAGPCFEEKDECRGEVYAIYILDKFKKQGIGKKLWQHAHQYLIDNHLIPYIVWVLKANEVARRFYEKNGGKIFKEKNVEMGGKSYTEVAYIFGQDIT